MVCKNRLGGIQSLCVMFTFLLATTAQVTLSNCTQESMDLTCTPVISAVEHPEQTPVAKPAPPALNNIAHSEFQISQPHSTSTLPGTVSLLLLGALLIVILVRTKRFNSK